MKIEEKRIGNYIHNTVCRFCKSSNMAKILDFGNVPLAGGFLKKDQFDEEEYYPLDLHFCNNCTLVQVTNAVPKSVLFENYFYFSSSIKTLVDHSVDFARETMERFLESVKQPVVVELGSNDGVMLRPFKELGAKAIGVEPAKNVVESIEDKNLTVVNDFFSEDVALRIRAKYGQADAFLSSYSFAHIDDMIEIMKGIKCLLKEDGVFIFEVYYLGTLIEEMQYDMIYHEHFSYYSLKALSLFLERFGMEIFDVKYIPGVRAGAVRYYARNMGKRPEPVSSSVKDMIQSERDKGYDKVETYLGYADRVNSTREQLLALLDRLKGDGKNIIGYGASGRGTIIMNYCGIDDRYLDYVVDDAPAKHGFYTPGTHVAIKPWSATEESQLPDYVLQFAWSFINEIVKKRKDYLDKGGKFIVPLPQVRIIPEK